MRILNKISSCVAIAGLGLLALSSCSNDDINYSSGTYPDAQSVYFSVQDVVSKSVGVGDTNFLFNVYRASTDVDDTVTLQWSGDTELFDLPTTATFENGALMSVVEVTYDVEQMDAAKPYSLKVEIPGGKNTPYTQSYIDFQLTYFPMSEWMRFGYDEALGRDGEGAYTFVNYYGGTEDPVLVEYCYSLVDENQIEYRFQWLIDNDNPDLGWETFLTATSSDGGKTIRVPAQVFAYNANYGDVYVSDMYYYTGDPSYNDSYFDDITGTFYLDLIAYVSDGYFGYGYETCVMNGYLDTNDYTVNLTDLGMVEIGGNNYELISMSWDAAALVRYTAVETSSLMQDGEINEDLLADLAGNMEDGSVDSSIAAQQGNYSFSFDSKGNYTVVVVGYKEENDGTYTQQSLQYVSFDYETTDPNEGWNILGYALYTDGYLGGLYGVEETTYYVELQESQTQKGLYRLVNPYGADYPWNEPGDWDPNVTSYLYVNASNPDCVYIPESPQTLDWGDGALTCYSLAAYQLEGGATEDQVIAAGVNGTVKDGKITFPEKSLLAAFGSDGWYYTNIPEVQGYTDLSMFCLDLNSVTSDPSAAAKAKAHSLKAGAKKGAGKKVAIKAQNLKKQAHVVGYNSRMMNKGIRNAGPKYAPVGVMVTRRK